ncbi:DNA mismatch repair endonuclease MutL [Agaribacter marinus]|uniref:DNA mismatch repair protein MutL n=1 Tax=Agaribacter marinus TaxID=1431249 RepID=A0AA37T0R8_9ALTE|nr:DNA mismatch repair endonuclease MutL [Agaribacter marinus]GLR71829.1 DNA mismatch repair protein MutL [Agaribacter marinus]
MSADTLAKPTIRVLPPQLANQIAAGEVVERPASVVKELVENSIDAGATSIHVEIEQGGHKRICIRDNGRGIAKDELRLALSRHATSKIYGLDDLDAIVSMGFRGEALASISSVSRCLLTSKPVTQDEAWQAKAEGRDMDVEVTPAAHPNGTSVDVVDLFYNTPARRRFLRAAKTEFQHIEHVIKRIALGHANVAFELTHNNKKILKFPAATTLKRIEQVCKPAFVHEMAEVNYAYEELVITGWVSKVGVGFDNNEQQYLFINNRMMKDRLLMHAIRQAYEGMLPDAKYSGFVIFLHIPPDELDVNVHPAKHEVRFRQGRKVHDAIFKAISEVVLSGAKTESKNSTHEYFSPEKAAMVQPRTDDTERPPNQQNSTSIDEQATQVRDYVRPIQTISPQGPGLSSGVNKRSGASGLYKEGFSNNSANAAITEAGRNYQSLMTSASRCNQAQSASPTADSLECLLFNEHLLINIAADVSATASTTNRGSATKLFAIPIDGIVSAFLKYKFIEPEDIVQQPLLMPVSVQHADLHSDKSEIDRVIQLFAQYGFTLTANVNKVTLKQVPAFFRQLPWAKMFAPLVSSILVSIVSKNQDASDDETLSFFDSLAINYVKCVPMNTEAVFQLVNDAQLNLHNMAYDIGRELNMSSLLLNAKVLNAEG